MLNVAPSGTSDVQELISATGRGKPSDHEQRNRQRITRVHLFVYSSVCWPIYPSI